ncbi:hypothetical protein [Thermocoleostomius sinensis]|jgi:hypothetical protein|uniref:Uncharacterized protein n=1 Tax=Thermocoleostomius sinensis A174 TaxID=2016057 RepID=A0A9E9CA56_9CYAN|nr:hypothetical protein [Thermocoleostomius sinensis]WAL60527.1 hypothetical protein OXH18_00595 [Thermocoleostomius sinensis A174]
MISPENFQAGTRVEILYPETMVGKIGVILGPEVLGDGQPSDRWLIQVEEEAEATVLSLSPDEFRLLR